MALSIKSEDADTLARELAAATQESLTQTVTTALRERLERVRLKPASDIVGRLERLAVEYEALPVADDRGSDELIGYDEAGLPVDRPRGRHLGAGGDRVA